MIQLGQKARDVISNFEGVVTGVAEYLTGCRQLLLSRGDDTGRPQGEWFDEDRLDLVDDARVELPGGTSRPAVATGGPQHTPPRRS